MRTKCFVKLTFELLFLRLIRSDRRTDTRWQSQAVEQDLAKYQSIWQSRSRAP